jgi:hypothetical protein
MALNPFFLNGTSNEQSLIQDLINEQLKMYGVDIMYIPRKILKSDNILGEIQSSKFDDNFVLEAYINNYDGYSGAGDLMTKFGVSLKDEVTLTISQERYEEFIAPILTSIYNPNLIYNDPNEVELVTRPREGDLIYFPLGQRLFEVKFVEHEKPFYQLGKTYVYELQCELFEYEDELIDTSVSEVDELIKDVSSTITLVQYNDGQQAVVRVQNMTGGSGYVRKIYLNEDGNNYTSIPTVNIQPSPIGLSTANATAVAITTSIGNAYAVSDIFITNTGYGYDEPPIITISGGGGVGAAATALIETSGRIGIGSIRVYNPGVAYFDEPLIGVSPPPLTGIGSVTAVIVANQLDASLGSLTFGIKDAGAGYYFPPTATVGDLPVISIPEPLDSANSGIGTFQDNEEIAGQTSGSTARVRNWNINSRQLLVAQVTGDFISGETIVGTASSARWTVKQHTDMITEDPYDQSDEFENEGIGILDFTEENPFGNF